MSVHPTRAPAMGTREPNSGTRTAVGRLIRASVAEAAHFDTYIRTKSAHNADKLCDWTTTSHIELDPRGEKQNKPPTSTDAPGVTKPRARVTETVSP